jgi:signal peptidase II
MAEPPASARRPRRLLAAIVIAVVTVDQVSKALAVHYLSGRGIVNVLGGAFHLQLYRNFAGSGNRFTGHPVLVSVLALLAVVAIGTIAVRVRSRTAAVAGGLMLGGGIGNLLDRLLRAPGPLRGGVVDWLKPTVNGGSMNLSDVAITAGVAVIVVGALVGAWRSRSERPVPGEV